MQPAETLVQPPAHALGALDQPLVLEDLQVAQRHGAGRRDAPAFVQPIMNFASAGASRIARWTRSDAMNADSGTYALVTALAMVMMSGCTPQCSSANQRPVRPKPVITSSAMSSTSLRSQISRRRGQ